MCFKMSGAGNPDITGLIRKLAEIERAIEASVSDQVDVIVDPVTSTPLLLRRAQEALIAARDQLENEVKERTAELQTTVEALKKEAQERKRVEEGLRESEEKYRTIVETANEGIWTVDAERKTTYVNNKMAEMLGYSPEEMIGRSGLDFTDKEGKAISDLKLEQRQQGIKGSHEFKLIRRNGSPLWTIVSAQPLLDEDGKFAGSTSMLTDITERKTMEEALKKSAEKIKLFAYSVSHDLKSPAVGIYGLTQLLHRHYGDIMDDRGRNYCTQILRTAEQIASLVEKINLYVIAKEAPLNIERLNVKKILQMVKDELSTRFNVRRIEWLEPESMPEIKADRLGILRILRNLVDNALKYGGDSLSRIRFGYGQSDKYYILSVNDNGVGIRKESVEQIFKPFHRDAATKEVEGTGLGLAIVKEIADQHGGDVWVESEPGKGTTFYVSIPENL